MEVDAVEVALDPVALDDGAGRVFSTKTPASIFSRSLPDPRMVSPRTTAPGAETVTTLPLPFPTRIAPGSPSSVSLRVIRLARGARPLEAR